MSEKIDIVISPDASLPSSAGRDAILPSSSGRDASLPSSSSRDDWLNLMRVEKKEETGNKQKKGPIITQVPSTFRKIKQNRKCYDPSVVSIGPYHHGKEEFKEMEELKVTLARQFIQDSGKAPEEMYRTVEEVASNARDCYTEDSTKRFDDEKFSHMLFLDGCFILHFLFCRYKKPENLKMSSHDAALVTKDLFLLENQLPFFVLKSLMSLRFEREDEGEENKMFEVFFKRIRAVPPRQRESFRGQITKFFIKLPRAFSSLKDGATDVQYRPAHLLEFFHMKFVGSKAVSKPDSSQTNPNEYDSQASWYQYYPAEDLRKVGIHFKPSKSNLFTDVHFRSTILAGRIRIPPLSIDDSTKSLLLNLVAYEACLETSNDWITSYVCFMDSLIDHPEDVKELRSQGILLTSLGSDQQVAELFNEIANNLVPNPYAFMDVKRAIESHYKNTFKRWILHYKGPIYGVIIKYSFLYGIIVTALKAYVSSTPPKTFGICRIPDTNVTQYP